MCQLCYTASVQPCTFYDIYDTVGIIRLAVDAILGFYGKIIFMYIFGIIHKKESPLNNQDNIINNILYKLNWLLFNELRLIQ